MANYYGSARTNRFKVKDIEAFTAAFEEFCEIVVDGEGDEATVLLLANDCEDSGTFPSTKFNEDTDEYDEFDLIGEIAEHLRPDSVAVFMESGAEKLRYLGGRSVAINSDGERIHIDIHDIIEMAEAKWPGKTVTECCY